MNPTIERDVDRLEAVMRELLTQHTQLLAAMVAGSFGGTRTGVEGSTSYLIPAPSPKARSAPCGMNTNLSVSGSW